MTITVSVPDQLASRAAGEGLSVEAYVEKLAREAVHDETLSREARQKVAEAIAHIRKSREGVTLGGLRIKDLIHEGHRY